MSRTVIVTAAILTAVAAALILDQFFILKKAHSTFDNYYAFCGRRRLLEKKTDYGTCRTASGRTIKIVRFQGKWYLDGDLPWACAGKRCFSF